MSARPERIVATGASNLTRGFPVVVASARSAFGPEVEILAAHGLGRSYGLESRVLARTLPSILDCGLWSALDALPRKATRALVTDVGNDILYGASAEQILRWVEAAVERLSRFSDDVVVAGLPVGSIRCLSRRRFLVFRTAFYPRCRLPFAAVADASARVEEGLASLAARHGARFVPLRPEWYGYDPVHFRVGRWRDAWEQILGAPVTRPAVTEALRILALPAERRRVLGVDRRRPQPGLRLPGGGRVWMF